MLTAHHIAETLGKALASGQEYSSPYRLTVFKPFSDALYADILAHLPDDAFYSPLGHRDAVRPDGTSTRNMFSFKEKSVKRLPPEQAAFWREFNAIMRSREVCEVFLRHLEPELTRRFNMPLADIPCYPTARLGRDSDGYRITPHPDSADRVYTAQVYLAEDDSQVEVGTTVYRQEGDGSFQSVRRLPFLPNTGFCFARDEHTFHGVETVSLTRPRNNLHISCFAIDKDV
ncbi:MAG: hypothetical protein JJU26_05015 [Oceanicaulis sp.]|uniref:hypothetical protein n=1 Tax=Glycocaulis sp. TaxID=1969725 RepID=UPI0025C621D2|nr:hypothetical protein [Glycocaulis sp.]MCC5981061.1 hypothetical protein [Oceanicaulis sp.]MCH8522654.1 hypothetical protein [Glycocaulis sp.]